MNGPLSKLRVEWGVLGFCAWQAVDIVTAWRHSPFDSLGWLALGIWLAPTLASAFRSRAQGPLTRRSALLCWLALLTCLIGILTDMNFIRHVALALACAAITPAFRFWGFWLALSLAWMSSLGWLLDGMPSFGVASARLGLAAIAAWVGLSEMLCRPGRVLE